ncbi:hypothetical protein G6F31_020228 [Rhizopus arrhizus]|nr:hypothetical protein G6F31_020228 [Rhizopus arrhizus]
MKALMRQPLAQPVVAFHIAAPVGRTQVVAKGTLERAVEDVDQLSRRQLFFDQAVRHQRDAKARRGRLDNHRKQIEPGPESCAVIIADIR